MFTKRCGLARRVWRGAVRLLPQLSHSEWQRPSRPSHGTAASNSTMVVEISRNAKKKSHVIYLPCADPTSSGRESKENDKRTSTWSYPGNKTSKPINTQRDRKETFLRVTHLHRVTSMYCYPTFDTLSLFSSFFFTHSRRVSWGIITTAKEKRLLP